MTRYTMIDVDKVEVNEIDDDFICVYLRNEHNRAKIYFNKENLKKLIDYAQAELQDSELVEEGVGK